MTAPDWLRLWGGLSALPLADGIRFHDLEDFRLVICKPDRRVIYSGCQWSKIGESGNLGAFVMEKVSVVAARRLETAA